MKVGGGAMLMDATPDLVLPAHLADVDVPFMTALRRRSGVIDETNALVASEESGVGMTAGYFSDIKRVRCTYSRPTDAPPSFVVKAWPASELLPREMLQALFIKDISAYHLPSEGFYP